jgi:hypothetical protein
VGEMAFTLLNSVKTRLIKKPCVLLATHVTISDSFLISFILASFFKLHLRSDLCFWSI